MYTLYARVSAGSAAVEALLAELGLPHEIKDVPRQPDKSIPEWFISINPRGEVPTLILPDKSVMTESAAMMIYLADLHGKADFAPPPDHPQRARYLRAMLFLATGPYMSDLRFYYPERYSTDTSHAAAIRQKAAGALDNDLAQLADMLGKGPFLLGERFSAADIYAAMLVSWASDLNELFATHPNLKAHYAAVAARPRIRLAWQRNEMPH